MKTVLENVACKFCGCLCDDINIEVENNRIVKAKRACPNGRALFLNYDPGIRRPTVEGRKVSWEKAVAETAQILNKADSPLIYGLSSSAIEAQRKAVELADLLGAIIDSTSSVCHGPSGLAMQATGEPTCTLGEVRDRADLVIFWGCNPLAAHPRHFARYSVKPKGYLTPNGSKDRTVVVVDVRLTSSAAKADQFFQISQGSDFEVLTALRAWVRGKKIPTDVGGIPQNQLKQLAQSMKTCRFGVVFFGMGLTMTRGRQHNVSEIFNLCKELNQFTRFSVIPMRGHGNVAGADQVLTWQSGYPFGVSFARGYPQYGPGEFTAVDVLARKEADAALIIASDPVAHFPYSAVRHLEQIPTVVINPMANHTEKIARIVLPTACYGIDASGTSYRMDNVPIRLKSALTSTKPSDKTVLNQIIEAVQQC